MADSDQERRFTELLQRHHRRLYGYVFTLLRNHADAQDVFQQTSVTLWEKFSGYRPGTNFLTWACTVARFKALDFRKRKQRRLAHFSDSFELRLAVAHQSIPDEEFLNRSRALEDCIDKLPPGQRELLLECFGGVRSVAEIAKEYGRTPHSLYSSLRNIREKLLDCVESSVPENKEP